MPKGPLEGVRVVELCGWHTGPMATCIMADQGAEVIKIEPPGGDGYRNTGASRGGFGAMFMAANRNKRSITLDVKQPTHMDALLKLIARADVFIQNNRPGAMTRLGLTWERLSKDFPRLIYASISGYGQTGPNAKEGAFDTMLQALSGLPVIQAGKDQRPQLVKTLVVDKIISPMVAQAICSALYQRERTGRGCELDCAMLDIMTWWMWPDAMMNHTFIGDDAHAVGGVSEVDLISKTADGYLVATAHLPKEWEQFIDLVGKPELRDDPRLNSAAARGKNLGLYAKTIRESFGGKTTAEWCELLRARGIPCAPVLTPEEVADYPQVKWNKLIDEVDHPKAGKHRSVRGPVLFDGKANNVMRPVPGAGEHTEEILAEIGVKL